MLANHTMLKPSYAWATYQPQKILQLEDGGFIMAGMETHLNRIWVARLDAEGYWVDGIILGEYDADGKQDFLQDMIMTSEGNILVVGTFNYSYQDQVADAWIVKLDQNLNILWQKAYGTTQRTFGYSLLETPEHHFLLGCSTGLVKIDGDGHILWQMGYDTQGFIAISGSIPAVEGDGYLVWTSMRIMKISVSGEILWVRGYGTSVDSVKKTPGGGYIVQGHSALIKVDALGNVQWQKTYSPSQYYDKVRDVELLPEGGYVTVGDGYSHTLIMRLDEFGNAGEPCPEVQTAEAVTTTYAGQQFPISLIEEPAVRPVRHLSNPGHDVRDSSLTLGCHTCEAAPPAFQLLNPPEGAEDQDVVVDLEWTAPEEWPDQAASYDVYLGEANPPALFMRGVNAPRIQITGLKNATRYYWRIRAANPCGQTESDIWSFSTRCTQGPGMVQLIYPADRPCSMTYISGKWIHLRPIGQISSIPAFWSPASSPGKNIIGRLWPGIRAGNRLQKNGVFPPTWMRIIGRKSTWADWPAASHRRPMADISSPAARVLPIIPRSMHGYSNWIQRATSSGSTPCGGRTGPVLKASFRHRMGDCCSSEPFIRLSAAGMSKSWSAGWMPTGNCYG
jgi:hypothetical protein